MRHRTPELDTCVLKPVAIVGISAELPSGDYAEENLDHETFFRFLLEGGQAYQKIPMERFNAEAWKGHGLGKVITDRGAFLKNISLFDHVEFGISAKDARSMSVSTRKLIELSFLALLDSGIHYRGQRVGCYTSGIPFDILTVADPDEYEARGSFAGGPCMIANKISYHLDLLGPSIPTDTACSSSLTALHLAVQALRSGDCEAAVIGGCQLNHRFIDFIQYSQGGVLSPDGTCKPFDASANGFSRGEGAVVIVVKLLEDAIRDGDRIYASILGTSITANGSAAPANAPVGDAQAEAMRQAYKGTGRSPKEVDFIELHATGTAAGDPVEANWTGREFKRDGEIMIGSVKGNIGHLEISAFLASLSKICSMFSHGIIPPNVNMIKPNPAIEWDRYRLRVPLKPTPLAPRHPSGAALVSMMSSGIGGVNGHAVIEGPPAQPASSELYDPREGTTVPVLLVAGGLSPRSASSISATLEEELLNAPEIDLALVSTIYGRRARQMTWRSFAIVLPDRSITVPFVPPVLNQRTKRPIAFVFSGQGPQHFHMGRQLFQALPLFKDCIMRLDGIYRRRTGSSLIEMTGLFANHSSRAEQLPIIWPISITLPALTMVQIALCDVLRDIGIVPDIVIGHSAGETALLYACGAANAEMVMELAIARGQAMALADEGSMAAVSCTAGEAENIVQTVNAELCGILQVACYNATDSFTLVGHDHLIERAIDVAETRGFFARKLRTRVGVHSSLMDSCRDVYVKLVSEVFSRFPTASGYTPQIPVFSGLTGDLYDQAFTPDYFWHQTRLPVRFEEALSSLLRHSPLAMFLEIGPHPVLSAYISHAAADSPVLCPMRRFKVLSVHDEMQTYLKFVGQLVVLGSTAVDFRRLNELKDILYGILPIKPYPFQRKDIPYYPETSAIVKRQMASRNGPLNSPFLHISAQTHPSLSQHIIQGEPIMPAAGFLEMAFEFGAWSLWNVSFRSMLSLPSEKVTVIDVATEGLYWSVKSRSVGSNPQNARLHADGYMSLECSLEPTPALDIPGIKARSSPFSMTRFYSALSYFAQYGPQFQRVEATWKGENEALVQVRGVAEDLPDACEYIIHPAILDACLHVIVHPAFTGNADRNTYYLPSRVQWAVRHAGCTRGSLPETVFAHATFRAWKPDGLVLDIIVADSSGNYLCAMSGFEVAAHQVASDWTPDKQRFELINQPYSISPFLRNASSTPSPSVFHEFYQMYHHVTERVGKRVIRVLDLGSDEALTTELHAVTKQDSTTYCDYIVARKQKANPVIYPAGVKVIELELDTDQRDHNPTLNPLTFDIVLGSQLSPIDWPNATVAIELASRLLIPGGAFILQHPDFVNHTAIRVSDAFDSTAHCQDSTIPILFSQSRPLSISDIVPANVAPPASVIFELGHELEIQRRLEEMDDAQPLWIESIFDDHGAAAQGFTRSLRKELARPVHLVLFAQCWDASERLNMMRQLTQMAHLEQEIIIDSRRVILVPRLCPSIPPTSHHLNDTDYWIQTDAGSVSLLPLPTVPDDNILIRITATFPISQGLSVVAGDVVSTKSSCWMEGQHVMGLSGDPLSNFCVGHAGNFATNPSTLSEPTLLPFLGGIMVAILGFGVESLCRPQRIHGKRVLVTNAKEPIGRFLADFLNRIGVVDVRELSGHLSMTDLESIQSCHFIFSGFTGEQRQLLSRVSDQEVTHVFFWQDDLQALARSESWTIFDALPTFVRTHHPTLASMVPIGDIHDPQSLLDPLSSVNCRRLFDPSGVYLLVGGIGSLGMHIALWMYTKGARNLVLTSRSGRQSLIRQKNVIALRILSYLETLEDLSLTLISCDASSPPETAECISQIESPIRGVMMLSVQLSDGIFSKHSKATYEVPFTAKRGALLSLATCLALEDLDFLISMSSAAIFGNAGQTNYASANSTLDEMLREYKNAFSIIAPAIIDSSTIARTEDLLADSRLAQWAPWAMSSKDICNCIEDGLNILRDRPFSLYVPDYDWYNMQKHFGASPIYDHLVPYKIDTSGAVDSSSVESLQQLVLRFIDADPQDFETSIPLTSYGLDSLSAGRLSRALKPFVALTQLQLLADMSLDDVLVRMDHQSAESEVPDGGDLGHRDR